MVFFGGAKFCKQGPLLRAVTRLVREVLKKSLNTFDLQHGWVILESQPLVTHPLT